VNYQALNSTSGVVKDQFVRRLEYITQDDSDPRQARALFELGICHISGFGDPNQLSALQGLQLVIQAAQKDEITAKGYTWRLLKSLDEALELTAQWEGRARKWLLEAAAAGYEPAFEDLTSGYSDLLKKSEILNLRYAKRGHDLVLSRDLDEFKVQACYTLEHRNILDEGDSLLHWAAALNLLDHVRYLLEELAVNINCQDGHGDTAVHSACRAGQLESSILLIEFGADVNLPNHDGEIGLHHLWKFNDSDARRLLGKFVESGVNFNQEASFKQRSTSVKGKEGFFATELDPLPISDGPAIERIASRGRFELLKEFLHLGPPLVPANGNLVRRMILCASRLGFHEIRELLVGYSRGDCIQFHDISEFKFNDEMGDVEDSKWEWCGRDRNLMVAAAHGWVSAIGEGWRTPEIFWRICCHGEQWKERLRNTITSMVTTMEKCFCHSSCEDALLHSIQQRHHTFARVFLRLHVNAHQGRFRETPRSTNEGDHYFEAEEFCKLDPDTGPEDVGCGSDYSALNPFYHENSSAAPERAPLIDTILWSHGSTLVQYAIRTGDRLAFSMLVDEFGADVRRPWSVVSPHNLFNEDPKEETKVLSQSGVIYLNCYSLLALHSKDIWFA